MAIVENCGVDWFVREHPGITTTWYKIGWSDFVHGIRLFGALSVCLTNEAMKEYTAGFGSATIVDQLVKFSNDKTPGYCLSLDDEQLAQILSARTKWGKEMSLRIIKYYN